MARVYDAENNEVKVLDMPVDMSPAPALVPSISLLEGLVAGFPDLEWKHGDDLCDCVYQRIGMWKNVYLAQTHEIRLCCLFNDLAKLFPEHFRTFNGYLDDNSGEYITEPQPWNGEDDMPKALWHRQLARLLDTDLPAARLLGAEYGAPKGQGRIAPPTLFLRQDGDWVAHELYS
jgi:hypothetical protein